MVDCLVFGVGSTLILPYRANIPFFLFTDDIDISNGKEHHQRTLQRSWREKERKRVFFFVDCGFFAFLILSLWNHSAQI